MTHKFFLSLILSISAALLVALSFQPPAMVAASAAQPLAQAEQPQVVNAGPDLVIQGLTVTPANPTAGSEVTISFSVKNQGDALAPGGYRVHLYIAPADDPPNATTPAVISQGFFVPFVAGATTPYSFDRPGSDVPINNPKIFVWVDRDNNVAESNESNNLAVYAPATPDADAFEVDNSCLEAKAIATNGTEQTHNFVLTGGASKDEDWVKFEGASGVEYVVEGRNVGSDTDVELELHSLCPGAPSFGTGAVITFTAPVSGTYYVRVLNAKQVYGSNTGYTLKATSKDSCAGFYEANNSCSLAGDLVMNAAAQQHNFCQAGDIDWTRLEVAAGATYVITASNVGLSANVQMSLFGACDSNTSTANGNQTLQFTAPSAGYFYLKTENVNPNIFGTETGYTLRTASVGQAGCPEDGFEPDDTPASAKVIATNGVTQTRNTCPADDLDWVKFEATAGVTYTVETLNLATKADTLLCIHDGNGAQLVCDDDSGAGYGSRIVWQPGVAGNYFVRIKDYDAQVAGALTRYDLRINTIGCTPDDYESDNERSNAKPLLPGGAIQLHNTCPSTDSDWVSFAVNAGTYTLETFDVGAEADTIIEVVDASGTRLAQNDDHALGIASKVIYNFSTAGTYFARVRLFNSTNYGAGTEYSLKLVPGGTPTTATPTPTPAPTATPTPSQAGARTLILVNRAQLVKFHGEPSTAQLMSKVEQLSARSEVSGTILRLDNNATVSSAYDTWQADLGNVEKANLVASAIRQVIMGYLGQFNGVQFVVVVGDDRVIPLRRVLDYTPRQSERTYKDVSTNHPTGAAIAGNYYLTDDYFVDREPTPHQGRELYIPDLSIGRLIETPADMIGLIDTYLAKPALDNYNVLVTGYDFIQDVGRENCAEWKKDLGDSKVDCTLIADNWAIADFRNRQLNGVPLTYKIQSINGHAAHYAEGAPGSTNIFGTDIAAAVGDLSGGLIYTLGCHSGLNVPDSNSANPLDLAEAIARKKANYIGNSGYGWGLRSSIGLSEKLMRLYTNELLRGTQGTMGQALSKAKATYFSQDSDISAYDEKVMQQLIYYGLPMFQVVSTGALDGEKEFPNVGFNPQLPSSSFGNEVISITVPINFANALSDPTQTSDGQIIALDSHVTDDPDQPIQPLFFGDVTAATGEARSVVLRSATFALRQNFDPVVAAPYNEYVLDPAESVLSSTAGWLPDVPVDLTNHAGTSLLLSQVGQYNSTSHELRVYENMEVDIYYSTSADQTGPEIAVVDSLYSNGNVTLKVGASDASGIKEVVAAYIQDSTLRAAQVASLNLQFDASSQKWVGVFAGDEKSRFYVQVVDQAGNRSTATNKGAYYAPAKAIEGAGAAGCVGRCVYLPVVLK